MTYRLYRRDAVTIGEWYMALTCSGCGQYIYILDDISKGTNTAKIVGDGELSVPCNRCCHEGIYPATSMVNIQASESIPSTYPQRMPFSNSSRKPLSRVYPNAKVTMGVGYIEDRPRAAALVGRIITSWADIEVQSTRLLAELMGANIPQVAAVFASLRSSRSQSDAVTAAAEVVLHQNDLALLRAYLARKASLEKERNDLAHGCFGVSVSIPDDIIWVSQADFLAFTAAHISGTTELDFRKKQFVYEVGTLERIAHEISEFYNQLGFFTGYLSARKGGQSGQEFRKRRYPELCNQPHIREALKNLRNEK